MQKTYFQGKGNQNKINSIASPNHYIFASLVCHQTICETWCIHGITYTFLTSRDLDNDVKVTNILPVLFHLPVIHLCKFGSNPPINLGDMVKKKHFSTF